MTAAPPHPVAPPPREKSNVWMYVLLGCGGALLLTVLLCAGIGVYVWKNAKQIGAEGARVVATQAVNESQLPEDQKRGIKGHIDRLANDFKSGAISLQDLSRVMEEIVQSPLMQIGVLYFVDQQHIRPSDLTDEEKQDASLQLERFARGLHEGSIPMTRLDDAIAPISTRGPNNQWQVKTNPTTEELRRFIATVKKEADAHHVPNEPYQVDISDELGKVIDRALGKP